MKQAKFDFENDIYGRKWDYCVFVTNDERMDAVALSQLYRDCDDCENNFDEFKNQWGWGGFTTRTLKSCKGMAASTECKIDWLHYAHAQELQGYGVPNHHRRQLVEHLLPIGGSDGTPRGDHFSLSLHEHYGTHRREWVQEI